MKSKSEMKRVAVMNPELMAHKYYELQCENKVLKEENKILRDCANYYADRKHWRKHSCLNGEYAISVDEGANARSWLARIEELIAKVDGKACRNEGNI